MSCVSVAYLYFITSSLLGCNVPPVTIPTYFMPVPRHPLHLKALFFQVAIHNRSISSHVFRLDLKVPCRAKFPLPVFSNNDASLNDPKMRRVLPLFLWLPPLSRMTLPGQWQHPRPGVPCTLWKVQQDIQFHMLIILKLLRSEIIIGKIIK